MSGGSAANRAANWPNGRTANSTTSASPRATPSTRPQNRSGGHKMQPSRRRLFQGTPAILFQERDEGAMTTMRFDDLTQYSDVLRAPNGNMVTVRFVEP